MKKEKITVRRSSSESYVEVCMDLGKRNPELKKQINTSMEFFNHMLETLAWRGCMNLSVSVKLDDYRLTHVICEDVGLTMGEAFFDLVEENTGDGINGNGFCVAGIDEALARACLSLEDRALICFTHHGVSMQERVEDILSADLVGFLEGFVQGARATLHLDILKGENPHHIWESAFRAIGESMRSVMAPCLWRKGVPCGVKGRVTIDKS